MRHMFLSGLAVWLTVGWVVPALADRPEQFRVWGTTAPEMRAAPEGWDEVADETGRLTAPAPTANEVRQGFALLARDPFSTGDAQSAFAMHERVSELRASIARGEYEALSFAVSALEDLQGVQISVGDLKAASGAAIPADHIDVRVVRPVREIVDAGAKTYRMRPFLLERRDAFAIPGRQAAQLWLTVNASRDASPGRYQGLLTVQPEGRPAAKLRVTIQVLPFMLPSVPTEMGAYFPRPSDNDEMLSRELVDMREHSMNSVLPAFPVEVKSRDQTFGEDDVEAVRATAKRLLAAEERVFGKRQAPALTEIGHQIAYFWEPQKAWFSFWPHRPKIDDDLVKAVSLTEQIAASAGCPGLRVQLLDEAGAHSLLDEAHYYYCLIKQRLPQTITYTTIGGGIALGADEIGTLTDCVDFITTNRFTPQIARELVARGKPYGVYNGSGARPAGARYFYGFYGWKTGAQEISQWAYHFGDAIFQGNGLRQEDEGFVYHAPDGPLPSVAWEAVREGADDYRYVYLLSQLVAAARASGRPEAQAAADQGVKALGSILGKLDWRYRALAYSDCTPPPHSSVLRKWRSLVAQQIVQLQAALTVGRGALPTVHPPSPLDLSWAQPAEDLSTYGAELLPPSGFEIDLKPWRIEAWSGKGSGTLDPTEHHGGRQSVRVDIPATDGSNAVTVLIWPTWGGGGLNLTLDGQRVYELSAWVKLKDRRIPPSLRVSVPGSAVRTTRGGQGAPAADGWQRIWTRVELGFPGQPNYLAVWVQGPGTVWLDDLSLREIIPPPVSLKLDQEQYDGEDRVGVAEVTIAPQVKAARLRMTVSRADGEKISEMDAPYAAESSVASTPDGAATIVAHYRLGTCTLVFRLGSLRPGGHQVRVEALDGQGRTLGAQTASFTRDAD